MLFIFNFHPDKSYENYQIGTFWKSDHFIVYESDEERFGGFQRLNSAHRIWFELQENQGAHQRPHSIRLYLPARTCIILCPYENAVKIGVQNIPEMPDVTDRQRHQVQSVTSMPSASPVPQAAAQIKPMVEEKKEHETQAALDVDKLLQEEMVLEEGRIKAETKGMSSSSADAKKQQAVAAALK